MTTSTTDPVVAVLYGAMAYPSLRPGVTTAVDLVAGQAGPWPLATDPDRAALAVDLVARIRAGHATAPAESVATAAAVPVLDACHTAAVSLYDFWSTYRAEMPPDLRHDVEALEERLVGFVKNRAHALDELAATVAARAAVPSDLPTPEEADSWRLDQWISLVRSRGLTPADVVAAVADRVTAEGRPAPTNLRQVANMPHLVRIALDVLREADR